MHWRTELKLWNAWEWVKAWAGVSFWLAFWPAAFWLFIEWTKNP